MTLIRPVPSVASAGFGSDQPKMPNLFDIDVSSNRSTREIHRLSKLGKPHLAQITSGDQQTPPMRARTSHSPAIFQKSSSTSTFSRNLPSVAFPLLTAGSSLFLPGSGGVLIFAFKGAFDEGDGSPFMNSAMASSSVEFKAVALGERAADPEPRVDGFGGAFPGAFAPPAAGRIAAAGLPPGLPGGPATLHRVHLPRESSGSPHLLHKGIGWLDSSSC